MGCAQAVKKEQPVGVVNAHMRHIYRAIFSIAVGLLVAGCVDPGSDKLGRSLQKKTTAVLVPALDAYNEAHGKYPGSLSELTVGLSWLPEGANGSYRLQMDGHYLFSIDYKPSLLSVGRSTCQYSSMILDWKCYRRW